MATIGRRPAVLAATGWLGLLLGGCVSELDRARAGSVYAPTLASMQSAGMERGAPILVRVFKESKELEIWKQDRTGRYALLKSYAVCNYSGTLGPKRQEGDHQAPEGFYDVALGQMNPKSIEYLSFNLGYPNGYDRSLGRTGSALMIHGGCRSVGCYAMTDAQIEEIYGMAWESFRGGQSSIQVQLFPFRMTEANLQSHRDDPNMPFWRMLRRGDDIFARTGRPLAVATCEGAYGFAPEGGDAAGSCGTTAAL